MKISTKGRYGLRALVDLAKHDTGEPITLASIAERQKISLNYLEQVFGLLRKAELVKSVKGASGGYCLGRDAVEITVKEILEALEGRFVIVDEGRRGQQDEVQRAIECLVWNRIEGQVNILLENKTLEQLKESN